MRGHRRLGLGLMTSRHPVGCVESLELKGSEEYSAVPHYMSRVKEDGSVGVPPSPPIPACTRLFCDLGTCSASPLRARHCELSGVKGLRQCGGRVRRRHPRQNTG